jgi:hypothetical protein
VAGWIAHAYGWRASFIVLALIGLIDYGYGFNSPWFRRIEQESSSLMQVFGFVRRDLRLTTISGIEDVSGQLVSGAYFPALQVPPKMGRYIVPRDDRPGIPEGGVAVISAGFWRSHFAADPQILGRQLRLNQVPFTIVGVMPESFRGMDQDDCCEDLDAELHAVLLNRLFPQRAEVLSAAEFVEALQSTYSEGRA